MAQGGSGRGVSLRDGFLEREMEVRSSTGGLGVRWGGDVGRKIPIGGVDQRVGMAGEGVHHWEPEIH